MARRVEINKMNDSLYYRSARAAKHLWSRRSISNHLHAQKNGPLATGPFIMPNRPRCENGWLSNEKKISDLLDIL